MRNPWQQVTLVRVVLPLIVGITMQVLAAYWALPVHAFAIALSIVLLACVVFSIAYGYIDIAKQYKWRNANGVAITAMLAAFGFIYAYIYTDINHSIHFSKVKNASTYVVRITEPPIDKPTTLNAIAEVQEVRAGDKAQKTIGKVLLRFSKDEPALLQYGDIVAFKGDVKPYDLPMNPEQFNYKQYQANHNIYHTAYLNSDAWEKVGSDKNFLFAGIYQVRDMFLQVLRRYVKDENDFGVATALMLGYRDYLSDEVMRAYSSAGAIHILSVSGLHVGIMFLMLNFLLSWVDERNRKIVIAKSVFIIVFIWFYACLTGLSPSVLRSATMFSVIQIGTVLLRHQNMYNVLAGSALLIILFNPLIVTDVGFQLSYLAVVGIVYLYPMINAWFSFGKAGKPKHKDADWFRKPLLFFKHDKGWLLKNWLPSSLWSLMAVSIAAQLATAPVALYYFHQFPWLFLPANIVTVTVSNFIMFFGTALFALSWVPYVNDALAYCFDGLLHILNVFTFMVEGEKWSLQRYLHIQWWEAVAMLVLLWLVAEYFKDKTERERLVRAPITITVLIAILAIYNNYEGLAQSRQQVLTVYNVRKQSAIAYIDGQAVHHAMDSAVINSKRTMNFNIDNHWAYLGIDAGAIAEADVKILPFGKMLIANGKQVLLIDKNLKVLVEALPNKLVVDYVVLSHNAQLDIASLNKLIQHKQIIIDTSNKPKQVAKWKEECSQLNIACYDVNEQGAFVSAL